MKGLGRMVALATTTLMTFVCQGCVQTSPMKVVSPPVQVYEVSELPATSGLPVSPTLTLTTSTVWTQSDESPSQNLSKLPNAQGQSTPNVTFGAKPIMGGETISSYVATRMQEDLSAIPRDQRYFNGEIALSAPSDQTGLGLDVGIAPRFSMVRDGAFSTRRFGGEVRIGQDFDKRGEGEAQSSWYLFAGADGEALVWEPDETGNIDMSLNDMALRDKITVGDMQAGLSLQRGDGQLSLSYIRREVEYSSRTIGASETEEFAGISFTLRR